MARTKQYGRKSYRNNYNQGGMYSQPQYNSSQFGSYSYDTQTQPHYTSGGGLFANMNIENEEEIKEEEKENQPTNNIKPVPSDKLSFFKNPSNSFQLFKMERYEETRKDNPMLTMMEVIDTIAQDWENAGEEVRKQYEQKLQDIRNAKNKQEEMEEEKIETKPKLLLNGGTPLKAQEAILNRPAPPKRPLTAFFLYKLETQDQVKKENPEAKITEITKIVAGKWKVLDEETKKVYEKKHVEAKQKYEQEMKDYESKYGSIQKKRRSMLLKREKSNSESESESEETPIKAKEIGKKVDRPAPPKRPLSAFFLYKYDAYEEVKRENPEARIIELTKIICEKWKNLDEETKKAYEKKQEEAKKTYEQQIKEYETEYGPILKKRRMPIRQSDSDSE